MILWADSFDHYGSEAEMLDGVWAEVGSGAGIGWSLSTVRARTGTHSMRGQAGFSLNMRRVFGSPYTRVGVRYNVFYQALPSMNHGHFLFDFRDAANTSQLSICLQSTGALALYLGDDASPTATSSALMAAGGWNGIECWVDIGGSSGAVEVRLNGVTVLSQAGINTDPTGLGEVSQFVMYSETGADQAARWVDDIIAAEGESSSDFNNDFLGDRKVYTDFPDADTSTQDWTPSSGGAAYAMVDEAAPDDDGTYDEAGVVGDVMGLSFPDLPAEVIAVSAVYMIHRSRKTDAGDSNLQGAIQSGVDETAGEDRPMTTEFTYYGDVTETDPATGLPWTPGAVNAMTYSLTRTA